MEYNFIKSMNMVGEIFNEDFIEDLVSHFKSRFVEDQEEKKAKILLKLDEFNKMAFEVLPGW